MTAFADKNYIELLKLQKHHCSQNAVLGSHSHFRYIENVTIASVIMTRKHRAQFVYTDFQSQQHILAQDAGQFKLKVLLVH